MDSIELWESPSPYPMNHSPESLRLSQILQTLQITQILQITLNELNVSKASGFSFHLKKLNLTRYDVRGGKSLRVLYEGITQILRLVKLVGLVGLVRSS